MSTIIAGRFEQSEQSDRAVAALVERGVARSDISVFYVTPAGQHDATPIGGDEQVSPGAERAPAEAGTGAAVAGVGAGVVGAAIGVIAGLAVPMVGIAAAGAAAAGAYGGSLAGAMGGTMDAGSQAIRHAGMLVAVNAATVGDESVIAALRGAGALDLERADGTWSDGQWTDFDPTQAPRLVETDGGVRP